ncbi:MAG: hypothetical protein MI866_15875, partial [Bacteroidales bacterium]|nr:hypothetical protein [Bacteroidales bacterium]
MTDKFTVLDKLIESYPSETFYSEEKLKDLINLLIGIDNYSVFFDHCHNLGPNSGNCFNGNQEFPNALIRRAREVGSRQAFSEVDSYLESEKNKLECAILLYDIHIDTEFQFSNSVRVIRTSSLKSTELTNFLLKEN